MSQVSLIEMQNRLLRILPRVRTHARIYHRHVGCPVKWADAIQETIGLAYLWFRRLVLQGKHPEGFVSTLASYAAKGVRAGRRICGQLKAKDVLSEAVQRRHGFNVSKRLDAETLSAEVASDLVDVGAPQVFIVELVGEAIDGQADTQLDQVLAGRVAERGASEAVVEIDHAARQAPGAEPGQPAHLPLGPLAGSFPLDLNAIRPSAPLACQLPGFLLTD